LAHATNSDLKNQTVKAKGRCLSSGLFYKEFTERRHCHKVQPIGKEPMTNTVLLSNVEHADVKVDVKHSEEFGDAVNQVLIFPTEFDDIQREYPILICKDNEGAFQSVALLGLDRDENLFLDTGGWQARYVPALQQRGPFLIGFQEQEIDGVVRNEPVILVDLDHPRITAKDGVAVFLPHGGNSPYLEHVTDILRCIHQGVEVGRVLFAMLDEMGLLEPVTLEIKLTDTEQYNLPDYYTVSQECFMQLDGKALERLHHAGFLAPVFSIISSLRNVSRLIDMKNRKAQG
jgi:SapC